MVVGVGPVTYGMMTPEKRAEWLHEIGLFTVAAVLLLVGYRWLGATRSRKEIAYPRVAVTAYNEPMADLFCLIASIAGAAGARLGTALKPVSNRDAIRVLHDALLADGAWRHVRCCVSSLRRRAQT